MKDKYVTRYDGAVKSDKNRLVTVQEIDEARVNVSNSNPSERNMESNRHKNSSDQNAT